MTALIFNAAATGNSRDAPESSADDGAIPRRHDALAGWAAFRVLRQRPMPTPPRRHGNRKHGGYSKAGRESARWLRAWVRLLRRGVWDERLALPRRPKAPGWRFYRRRRGADGTGCDRINAAGDEHSRGVG